VSLPLTTRHLRTYLTNPSLSDGPARPSHRSRRPTLCENSICDRSGAARERAAYLSVKSLLAETAAISKGIPPRKQSTLQCNITKNSCEPVLVSGVLRTMPSVAALPAFRDTRREAPLDNHAPEKSGQERPEESKSRSEIESLGDGFERKRARNLCFFPGA
jgi:hypothetical protein